MSRFWIDYYGRVKLSQNAEQEKHNEYAYSKFDELGRPYEVGKLHSSLGLRLYEEEGFSEGTLLDQSELIFDSAFPSAGAVTLLQVNGGTPSTSFTLSERTLTFYDEKDVTLGGTVVVNAQQSYLRNRVAAVVVAEEDISEEGQALTDIGAITRYAYDIHGNVETLWQHLPEQTGLPEKRVDYDYDLLSGKVNQVVYQKGEEDEFRHRYHYDGDNRLIEVETSLDGYHWTLEAEYFYYAHGPLARIEVGEHNVQGVDYFYTLQGWIKGVNTIGLEAENDLGKDGTAGSSFNKDEFAYALNYYALDYRARGSVSSSNDLLGTTFQQNEDYNNFRGYQDELGSATYKRESLYNGNIAAMATSIRQAAKLPEANPSGVTTQSMNYRYDQLHRIAAAEASSWNGSSWQNTNGAYRTSYNYDGNGNIKQLYRNNASTQRIDEITYGYTKTNGRLVNNKLNFTRDANIDINGNPLAEGGLTRNTTYNYEYDKIGNLTQNTQDGIQKIEWNIYGKVERVEKDNNVTISYKYDGTGNRVMKKVSKGSTITTTTYVRDASGNVMAIYKNEEIQETIIYGSSRLGQYRRNEDRKETALGQRIYEFANHLGNVLVTLSDNKVPQTDGTYASVVVSASDYYPFGLAMRERTYQNSEYRFGFNGKENDTDFSSHIQDYGFRLYSRAGARFLSVDPLTGSYPHYTPYQFAGNMPITYIDLDGLEEYHYKWQTNDKGKPVLVKTHEEELIEYDFSWDCFCFEKNVNQSKIYIVHGEPEMRYLDDHRGNLTPYEIHPTVEYGSLEEAQIAGPEDLDFTSEHFVFYLLQGLNNVAAEKSGRSGAGRMPRQKALSSSSKSKQKALPVSSKSNQKKITSGSNNNLLEQRNFSSQGGGTDLIRSTTLQNGQNVKIKSGHGYNRSHRSGDVRDTGLTMNQVDNGILDHLQGQINSGTSIPQTGTSNFRGPVEFSTTINGVDISYRVVNVNGTIEVSTYFLTQ